VPTEIKEYYVYGKKNKLLGIYYARNAENAKKQARRNLRMAAKRFGKKPLKIEKVVRKKRRK